MSARFVVRILLFFVAITGCSRLIPLAPSR
jgi:hypothetical protein